jgi:hypothetical protein
MKKRTFWLLLGCILLFGFVTRLAALQHGLPYTQVIDENGDLSTALHYLQGEIPERHVRYHRSLIAYVNLASVGGFFGYSYVTGRVGGFDDFQNLYFSDRASFTVATRFTFAVLTTLAMLFVALTGRYVSQRVGLLAAAVLATNGFFLFNSLYAVPDALGMVAVALCLWMAMRLWHKRRARDYFAAGVSLALVMLSKFSGASVAVGMVIAYVAIVLENHRGAGPSTRIKALVLNRQLLWLGAGVVVGNLVFNPIAFLHPADLVWEIQYLGNYAYGSASQTLGQKLPLMGAHLMDTVRLMWRWLVPFSVIGAVVVFYERRKIPYWMIFGAFIVLFLTTVTVTTIFYKVFYWTPWLIPMSLVSAIGLDGLLRSFKPGTVLRRVTYGVVAAVFVLEAAYLFQVMNVVIAADTRQLAREYIAENIPPDTRILSGDPVVYSVPLLRNATSIDRARAQGAAELQYWDWWLSQPADQRPGPVYDLFGPETQAAVDTFDDVSELIRVNGIEYVIESDYCNATQNRPESTSWEEFPAISPDMRARWTRVAVFSPYVTGTCITSLEPRTALNLGGTIPFDQQARSGPMITIYRTTPGS